MSLPIKVLYWAEGPTDRAAALALIKVAGVLPGPDYATRQKSVSGKDQLDKKMPAYNAAAAHEPFLLIRDLDDDADCAPSFLTETKTEIARFMCFRIAVRSLEAWLMADAEALAKWLHVNAARVPAAPENLENPKQALLALVRESTSKDIKSDLLPSPKSGRQIGPLYAARLQEFIRESWDIRRTVPLVGRLLLKKRSDACSEQ